MLVSCLRSLLVSPAAAAGQLMQISRRNFLRPVLDSRELGSVSLLEIKTFLRQKSLDFKESHACLCLDIPRHLLLFDSNNLTTKWHNLDHSLATVYINKTTGSYVCTDLALAGKWNQLRDFLTVYCRNRSQIKTKPAAVAEKLPQLNQLFAKLPLDEANKKLLLSQAQPVENLHAQDFKLLLKKFRLPLREVKQEDFAKLQVRVCDGEQKQLLFPVKYTVGGILVGLRRVYVCEDTGDICEDNLTNDIISEDKNSSDCNEVKLLPFPYGLDRVVQQQNVVIVASALDALALAASNIWAVALADGFATLPPDHLPYFEHYKSITFWFPDQTTSHEALNTFARKLGERRCLKVSRDLPQPSQWIKKRSSIADGKKGNNSAVEVMKHFSRPCTHEYITTFESLREDVFLEMAHYEEIEGVKWKRFEALNELVRGFRRGELSVFSGRTGSGKTTFMSEYSLDLCMQGVSTLWGSFEVKNTRLAKMQLKQFSAVNLEEQLDLFDVWADRFQKLPMYYLTFHGAQEIEKVLDAMGHAVYIYDIAHVIIDNIQFMMGTTGRGMDRFYVQDLIVQKFRKFATLHNVHVTLVIHPRKEDEERLTSNSIFGGAKATQEADNVVLLQEEDLNTRIKRKYIQVVKNRFSGDLGIMPLFFNRGTLTFSKKIFQKEKTLAKRKKESPNIDPNLEGAETLPKEVLIKPDDH